MIGGHILRARKAGVSVAAALLLSLLAGTAWGNPGGLERSLPLGLARTELRGSLDSAAADFFLGPSFLVRRSVLTLTYSNALAVLPDGSSLELVLNDRPLARLPLSAAQGSVTVQVDIPPTALVSGRNQLRLVAEQRHRIACTKEGFDELWTRIEEKRSSLDLTLEPRNDNLSVADLPALLAASIYDGEPIVILSPRDPAEAGLLGWGSTAAQALAVMRGERPQNFEAGRLVAAGGLGGDAFLHRWSAFAGRNVVVIGTAAELAPVMGLADLAGARDASIAVRALPADPGHVAIILTGPDDAAVGRAVQALGSQSPAPPALARAEAGGPIGGGGEASRGRGWLGAGYWSLSELGYRSRDLPVGFAGTEEVGFDLPPDFYAGDGQRLALHLNFAYAAGLEPTSALHIKVNDAPWNMVRLDHAGGAVVDDERIELPMGLLRPGHNSIGFSPVLEPASGALCGKSGRAMFTLFDDSRVQLAPFAEVAVQPDLRSLAGSAFPLAYRPGDAAELVVLGHDPAILGAAWTLHGKLAQAYGHVLPATVKDKVEPSTANLLVMGQIADLPRPFLAHAPVALGVADRAPERKAGSGSGNPASAAAEPPASDERRMWRQRLSEGAPAGGLLDGLLQRVIGLASAEPEPLTPNPAGPPVAVEGGAVLTGFASPFDAHRTAFLVTASDAGALAAAVTGLVQPATWAKLDGDALRWDTAAGSAYASRTGATFGMDPLPREPRSVLLAGWAFLARNPAWWLGILALMLVTFVCLTQRALRRIEERRH